MLRILYAVLLVFQLKTAYAVALQEVDKPFGNWLVSCKENLMTAKSDCFIGSPFENEHGRGAIVLTKYYLAIAHNQVNLSGGIDLAIDKGKNFSSFMNTGVNVFFKNADRKTLLQQMSQGKNLAIKIRGITALEKSLDGFADAYEFYLTKVGE